MLNIAKRHLGLIILLLIIVFIAIFAKEIDFTKIIEYLTILGSDFGIILSVTAVAYLFAVLAWRHCMNVDTRNKIEIYELFLVRVIGESFTLINPANIVGGEALKVGLLSKPDLDSNKIAQSVFISRMLIIISFFVLMIAVLIIMLFEASIELAIWKIIPILVISIGLLYYFFRALVSSELMISKLFSSILSKIPRQKWSVRFLKQVERFNTEIVKFHKESSSSLKWTLLYSVGHWLVSSLEFFIILSSLGVDINYIDAMTLEIGVMVFKSIGGFIPGQLGIEEFGNKLMLSVLHFEGIEIWLAVSFIRRGRQIFWMGLATGLVFTLYRHRSRQLLNLVKH